MTSGGVFKPGCLTQAARRTGMFFIVRTEVGFVVFVGDSLRLKTWRLPLPVIGMDLAELDIDQSVCDSDGQRDDANTRLIQFFRSLVTTTKWFYVN